MKKILLTMTVLCAMSALAHAHMIYVVPQKDGEALIVFSDSLMTDERIDSAKMAKTTLFVRDASGKNTPLKLETLEHALKTTIPGSGNRVVYGTTDYGVLAKGDAKPFMLVYHPKTVVGSAAEAIAVGAATPVEIDPVVTGKSVRFRVISKGKPLAENEVGVIVPGKDKAEKVATDKDGLTPAFEVAGQYGVYTKMSETVSGEKDGKKYEEIRHYATLVVTVAAAK